MSTIAIAVKHLIAAGVCGDELVSAIADMEADIYAPKKRSAGAVRQARYRHNKALRVTESDACDAEFTLSSPEGSSPTPPSPKPLQSIPPSPPKGGSSPTDTAIFIYAENAAKAGLAIPRAITPERRRKIEIRLKEHGLESWQEACEKMANSPFCRGQNDRGWRADLDFLLQPKSFIGLLEGRYDGRPRGRSTYQHIDGRI